MTRYSFFETPTNYEVNGIDLSKLKIDEACVTVKNESDYPVLNIYQVHKECVNCSYEILDYKENFITKFQYKFLVANISTKSLSHNHRKDVICELDPGFGEFGVYEISIKNNGCDIETIAEPVSIYFPILTVFLIYSGIFLSLFGIKYIYDCLQKKGTKEKIIKKERVKSLDTFRGIAIVLMIFANFGCGNYDFCDHSIWNGLHVADLVFPWFMWIMGVCIPISIESSLKKNIPKLNIFKNVLKRSIKLFLLGIFLNFSIGLDYIRIFGVLQRFGVCYFVVSFICLFTMKKDLVVPEKGSRKHFMGIIKVGYGWISVLTLLTLHCLIVFLVADKSCPVGYLGPGGLHDNGIYSNCTGGATGYIDRLILGNHAFGNATIRHVYKTNQFFDPEGIVGCLTSILHVFIGVQAGSTLLTYKEDSQRLIRWLIAAIVTGLLGGSFCSFSKEDGAIPVNKNLWSLSFVLVTSCFAFTLLSICYYLIDVRKKWSGKPFLFAGMNAILMYIGHEMTNNNFPVRWRLHKDEPHPTHFVALLENVWGTAFWVIISYYLYKINYFFVI